MEADDLNFFFFNLNSVLANLGPNLLISALIRTQSCTKKPIIIKTITHTHTQNTFARLVRNIVGEKIRKGRHASSHFSVTIYFAKERRSDNINLCGTREFC